MTRDGTSGLYLSMRSPLPRTSPKGESEKERESPYFSLIKLASHRVSHHSINCITITSQPCHSLGFCYLCICHWDIRFEIAQTSPPGSIKLPSKNRQRSCGKIHASHESSNETQTNVTCHANYRTTLSSQGSNIEVVAILLSISKEEMQSVSKKHH